MSGVQTGRLKVSKPELSEGLFIHTYGGWLGLLKLLAGTPPCSLFPEQKWGSAAQCHLQTNSEDKGWWGRKKVFIKMCTIWEEEGLPSTRLIPSSKPRQNPAIYRTRNSAQKSHSIHICPLEPEAVKWTALWLQAPSWSPCVGPTLPSSHGFQDLADSTNTPAYISVLVSPKGKRYMFLPLV